MAGKGLPPDKVAKVEYPSQYGSHASMIVEEETKKLEDQNKVVLLDEHGLYETDRNRLDNRRGDPNRYATSRLKKLFAGGKSDK